MKSDVEELMPRLLPIEFGARSADLDLSGPPRNPQEYLRQVQSVWPLLTRLTASIWWSIWCLNALFTPASGWRHLSVRKWWSLRSTPRNWGRSRRSLRQYVKVSRVMKEVHKYKCYVGQCMQRDLSIVLSIVTPWLEHQQQQQSPKVFKSNASHNVPSVQTGIWFDWKTFLPFFPPPVGVSQMAGCPAAPVGFSPSLSWQQQQVGTFSDVRQVERD